MEGCYERQVTSLYVDHPFCRIKTPPLLQNQNSKKSLKKIDCGFSRCSGVGTH